MQARIADLLNAVGDPRFGRIMVDILRAIGTKKLYDMELREDTSEFKLHLTPFAHEVARRRIARIDTGNDWIMLRAASLWLAHGPKVARPSPEMCEAMEQVEVRLGIDDLTLPFPEICVIMPERYTPVRFCLVSRDDESNTIALWHYTGIPGLGDVITNIRSWPAPWVVEEALEKFGSDCTTEEAELHCRTGRIALNTCLMLTNQWRWADPHLAESDARLAREKTERGERARIRNSEHLRIVEFDRSIVYRRDERAARPRGEPTGREMSPGWRRGHWKMQPHGPGSQLRKRILVAPYFVRLDLLPGGSKPGDFTQEYKL